MLSPDSKVCVRSPKLPSILLTNANHILNKIDELYILTLKQNIDIVCITETWLNDEILDDVCKLPGYNLFRRDRLSGQGGGVLCYVDGGIDCRKLDDLTCASADFELMWVALRPRLLPRPISIILLGIVYCPPWYGIDLRRSLSRYIVSCVDELNRKFTNAGFILTGDFNALETSLFNKYLHFKQVVTKGTRGLNILDKIFTNVSDYYFEPVIWPPLGKSDHNCVYLNSVGQIRPVTEQINSASKLLLLDPGCL